MPTWITIEDKRIRSEQIARYFKTTARFDGNGQRTDFESEVEMASGKVFSTKLTLEELDKLVKGGEKGE